MVDFYSLHHESCEGKGGKTVGPENRAWLRLFLFCAAEVVNKTEMMKVMNAAKKAGKQKRGNNWDGG